MCDRKCLKAAAATAAGQVEVGFSPVCVWVCGVWIECVWVCNSWGSKMGRRELQKGNRKGCRDIFRHLLPIECRDGEEKWVHHYTLILYKPKNGDTPIKSLLGMCVSASESLKRAHKFLPKLYDAEWKIWLAGKGFKKTKKNSWKRGKLYIWMLGNGSQPYLVLPYPFFQILSRSCDVVKNAFLQTNFSVAARALLTRVGWPPGKAEKWKDIDARTRNWVGRPSREDRNSVPEAEN